MPDNSLELFVPGRLCLFGEHTDWAGSYRRFDSTIPVGKALVTGVNQGLTATVERGEKLFEYITPYSQDEDNFLRVKLDGPELKKLAEKGGFFSYVSAAALLMTREFGTGGLRIRNSVSDLPIGRGLASSAAACVLTVRAFNRLYGLGLSESDEMDLAYRAELLTPSRCGRMDQICAFGRTVMHLVFDGDIVTVESVKPAAPFRFIIVDLMSGKDTIQILTDLHRYYPRTSGSVGRGVREFLGRISPILTSKARRAMESGDTTILGNLMKDSQYEFDRCCRPASPKGLKSPRLDRLLNDPFLNDHALGFKGVGSHGDGCAQILARDETGRQKIMEYVEKQLGYSALPLDISPEAS